MQPLCLQPGRKPLQTAQTNSQPGPRAHTSHVPWDSQALPFALHEIMLPDSSVPAQQMAAKLPSEE